MSNKFPFIVVQNKVTVQNTFNASFSCKYQTPCKYKICRPQFVFKYRTNDNDYESFTPTNFFFHEFHKLSKHLYQTNDFSLFHRNICLLSANLEKLETLISNLEFSFSVIAVSETWTPKGKDEVKPRKFKGYQNYHGNRGSSIKSGCGDYVKKGIKFKL